MSPSTGVDPGPSWGRRLAGIEGLRGIAAISVMTGHVMVLLPATNSSIPFLGTIAALLLQGLTLFFVLSGFLLFRPYVSAVIDSTTPPRSRDFLRNRVLRIWPAYLVILLASGLVLGVSLSPIDAAGNQELGRLTEPWVLLANIFLIQGWFPSTNQSGLGVSWSLVTEVSFYLLIPVFGAVAVRLAPRVGRLAAVLVPTLALLVVGITGRFITLHVANTAPSSERPELLTGPTWNSVIYHSILGHGDLFAVGMLSAIVIVVSHRNSGTSALRLVGVFAAVTMVIGVLASGRGGYATPLMGLLCAAIIVILKVPRNVVHIRLAVGLLESWPLKSAGLCSYSVYLWHLPVILFLSRHFDTARYSSVVDLVVLIALVYAVTFLLASITYRFVEVPWMRRKHRTDTVAV